MRKALIIVDVQNDFCPGGTYPVPNGDEVVEPLNKMIDYAKKNNWFIVTSRDWHPVSTEKLTGWTPHCIQNTKGAEYHPDLKIDENILVINKGEDLGESHYSAFNGDNISLESLLRDARVEEVYIGGLAADYCVKNTAVDSAKKGFKTYVLWDATRGIFKKKTEDEVKNELIQNGVKLVKTKEILKN